MVFQKTITFRTHSKEALYDITSTVEEIVQETADNPGIASVTCSVYAQGATGAIMIQENWDHSVQTDVLTLLRKLAPPGVWEHDRQDSNGDSHLKAGLIGPSETIPVIAGKLALSRCRIFFYSFPAQPQN